MSAFQTILDYFFRYDSPLYWRDVIEIIFFAALFYYAALWLKRDRQKNLLPAFYSYSICAYGSHVLGLTTISYVLFLFAPVAAMIFILIHQEMLQRNIVALKNITPARRIHLDWLETLIRTSLLAINNGKKITCVIERQDALQDFLETPLYFNAQLKQELLNILLASPTFDQGRMLWVNTQGNLVGINATWPSNAKIEQFSHELKALPNWKQKALLFTTKTDAIVMHISPTNRTFDIVINGMVIDKMHATKTLDLIKKYVITQAKGGIGHENPAEKSTFKQRSN